MGRIIKTYDYDEVSFDLKDIYDNSYAYIDVAFTMNIHFSNLFEQIENEILNNPKEYLRLNMFLKKLTEEDREDIIGKYIDLYPGDPYKDVKGDTIPYNTISVKVRYKYDWKDTTVEIEDIYYNDIHYSNGYKDFEPYEEEAKEIFGKDRGTRRRFMNAMNDYINAYDNVTRRLIKDAIDNYFLDIVEDNLDMEEIMSMVNEHDDEENDNEYNEEYEEDNEGGLAP